MAKDRGVVRQLNDEADKTLKWANKVIDDALKGKKPKKSKK